MQIVIPMAGLGKRFSDAGYTVPKPLIPIDGKPMIVRVLEDLPPAVRVVCVVHPAHVQQFEIERLLRDAIPDCQIVVTPGLTEGQACTVRLAADYLNPEDSVLVGACDNTHSYSADRWEQQTRHLDTDAIVWTYRGEPRVLAHPHWFGWVDADSEGLIRRMSVKVPISTDLVNDHVVSGTFWFRNTGKMIGWIDRLVATNQRVNNEFYMDSLPDLVLASGGTARVFEVDKYIGWGTPQDLEDYLRWSRYFSRLQEHAVAL